MEDLSLDGAALDHRTLVHRALVEPCLQERLNGRRDDDIGVAVAPKHQHHLLDEEWVALGSLKDSLPRRIAKLGAAEQVVDQQRRLLAAERLEQKRGGVRLPAAPGRAELE